MTYTQTEIGFIPQGVVANAAGALGTTAGNLFNGVGSSLHGAARAAYGGLQGTVNGLYNITAAVVGSAGSIVLGSAKFVNGATSGAFSYLFGSGARGEVSGSRQQSDANSGGFFRDALNIFGRIWASPNTLVGLAYGGVGKLFGATSVWDNETGILHFTNMPKWMMPSAMSLGHAHLYGAGYYKGTNNHDIPIIIEETLHTGQAEIFGPFYLPLHAASMGLSILTGGGTHDHNVFEMGPQRGRGLWPWSR